LNDFFKTSLEHYERFIYQNLDFFNLKQIKYEFLKRQKLKIKLTKSGRRNQILRQFFAEELLVMFLTRLQKLFKNSRV